MQPKSLYLSLKTPASIRLEKVGWSSEKRCSMDGIDTECDDAPWVPLVADLLIDKGSRTLVGMTFPVQRWDWDEAKCLVATMDRNVVRFDEARNKSDEDLKKIKWVELIWGRTSHAEYEVAQLLCGQWYWFYSLPGNTLDWHRVVAFGLTDINDILRDHDLTFADASHLPPLSVEWH